MSYSVASWNTPLIEKQRIIDLCKVPEKRIWSIYLSGSQVYGTNTLNSDFDFLVVASSLHKHKEFYDGTYNIHVKTPDTFNDELWAHQMLAMECIYAPYFAKIEGEKLLNNFKLDYVKLKRKSLSESYSSWFRAKRMLRDGDVERGMKSIWHSIRILMFALQIMDEGNIYDFSEANGYWEQMVESDGTDWTFFKDMLLPLKRDLENMLRA